MKEIKTLTRKTLQVLRQDGFKGVQKRAKHYMAQKQEARQLTDTMKDVLFINGCSRDLLPQSVRYRVDHQKEQLECFGMTCDEIYYKNIQPEQVRLYRVFIIFRCVHTEALETFIKKAQACRKKVFYDVDDLVIDTCYTDQIPSLSSLSDSQREQYDQDVLSRKQLLSLCDGAITTTERLAFELRQYVPLVFINRNSASMEMVKLSQSASKETSDQVHIGYFSGSMTHNDDVKWMIPVFQEILRKYPQVRLHLTGYLDCPSELQPWSNQIEMHPLVDWRQLPEQIAKMDINLAPLCPTIFNEAKSAIKWMEAALVKTCTVASDIGAFHQRIQNHKTGCLCQTTQEWIQTLEELIEHPKVRETIAQQAYQTCMQEDVTVYNGYRLAEFLRSHQSPNIVFAMTKIEISGGIMVAFRHMCALRRMGVDVSILSLYDDTHWTSFMGQEFPVLPLEASRINGSLDRAVATMWPTVELLEKIPYIHQRLYLVQNFETDFYDFTDSLKQKANRSYQPKTPFEFITISKWCQNWLFQRFGYVARYAPNGIDLHQFQPHKRSLTGKIRILVEGDCQAPHKNVDESFQIVDQLDLNRFEVWYMSYNASPKSYYRVDRFFHRIPYEEVPQVYGQCDILLKTSLLESFSYPPLEMMATGGYVVGLANDGNKEYLQDGWNALLYKQGDIQEAVVCIQRLIQDDSLQDRLYQNGIECAQRRDWQKLDLEIWGLYWDDKPLER